MNRENIVNLFNLKGRVALVTGAAEGLGKAIAMGLACYGADLGIADVNESGLAQAAQEISALGSRCEAFRCDVSQPDQITALFQQVDQVFGRLDILVNNVGIIVRERPENLSLESWERVLRVNLTGAFLCAQEAGRRMIARGTEPPGTEPPGTEPPGTEPPGTEPSGTEPSGTEPPGTGGSIINISSISGWSALGRGNLAYSVSKSAINQLTRELAVEWAKHKIRVNALMPAQVRTAYLQRMFADPNFDGQGLLQRLLTGIPLNRLGEVEDLVGPAVFLASDASAFITGALLPVDGGNLALNAGGSKDW